MLLSSYIKSADWKAEKHAPVVSAPSVIAPGVPFDVEVSVGKGIPHPNTVEHHIAWIALYFVADGSQLPIELGRADFTAHSAVSTAPIARFTVALDKPGTLHAVAYCNLHGLWEGASAVSC
jgi:superoxide reductase